MNMANSRKKGRTPGESRQNFGIEINDWWTIRPVGESASIFELVDPFGQVPAQNIYWTDLNVVRLSEHWDWEAFLVETPYTSEDGQFHITSLGKSEILEPYNPQNKKGPDA